MMDASERDELWFQIDDGLEKIKAKWRDQCDHTDEYAYMLVNLAEMVHALAFIVVSDRKGATP